MKLLYYNWSLRIIIQRSIAILVMLLVFYSYIVGIDDVSFETSSFGDIDIYHHHNDYRVVQELGNHILHDIYDFQHKISFYPEVPVVLVVAPNQDYYDSLTAAYSGIIEFSEAFYSSKNRTIYIRNPRNLRDFGKIRTIILHEYIHLFIDYHYHNVPLWFHEGMAVFFSNDLSFDRELLFAKEFLIGNTLPLSKMIEGYPPNHIQWNTFYTKSALAVKYLYSRHTEEFYDFWDLTEQTSDFQFAFNNSFMMSLSMFSNTFDEYLERRFTIEILLSFTGFIWALLPLILLIAWIKKKIKAYRIKKSWIDNID